MYIKNFVHRYRTAFQYVNFFTGILKDFVGRFQNSNRSKN